ncbi:MAG: hypothetical protein HC822_23050 [Oscillochloris sp.]|nr:hypothetical protein [Oscillochloris sp.]
MISSGLTCALSGRPLKPEEAYWAPPLVTTRDLISTIFRTLTTTPGALGQVLMAEMPNVPYAPEMREELGARRTSEQLKLLAVLLLIAALLIVPIVLLAI